TVLPLSPLEPLSPPLGLAQRLQPTLSSRLLPLVAVSPGLDLRPNSHSHFLVLLLSL
ncbi:MAG: hypothetical protein FD142_3196, partial [bacterium]